MALTATYADPVTGIGADGFESFTKLAAADANEYILQNIMYLKSGRALATEQDFDGTVFSTTSSTFQDTGVNVALTTTGGRVLVVVFGTIGETTSVNKGYLTLYQDGVNVGDATWGMIAEEHYNAGAVSEVVHPFCIAYHTPTAPTAGAHEWKLYLRSANNSTAWLVKTAHIWAMEIGA